MLRKRVPTSKSPFFSDCKKISLLYTLSRVHANVRIRLSINFTVRYLHFHLTVSLVDRYSRCRLDLGNTGEFISVKQVNMNNSYLKYKLMKRCFIGCWLLYLHIFPLKYPRAVAHSYAPLHGLNKQHLYRIYYGKAEAN